LVCYSFNFIDFVFIFPIVDFVGAYAAGTGGVSGTSRDASDLKKESLMSASIPTMKSPSIVEECPF
jgi:hypothetical protein